MNRQQIAILGALFTGGGLLALGGAGLWLVAHRNTIHVGDRVMLIEPDGRPIVVCRDRRWLPFVTTHSRSDPFPKTDVLGGPFLVASGLTARVSEVHPNGYRIYIDRFDDRGQDVYVESIFVAKLRN